MTAEKCRALAGYFSFAAGLYLKEPSSELLGACAAAGAELSEALPWADFPGYVIEVAGDDPGKVKQEFFDLFFVPMSGSYLPPFEEVNRTDGRGGEARRRLGDLYRLTGFDPRQVPMSSYLTGLDRGDHMGLELSFLASLFESAAGAEEEVRTELLETAGLFCRHHFGLWARDYGDSLQNQARTNLYKALGGLTAFLADAAADLGSTSSEGR